MKPATQHLIEKGRNGSIFWDVAVCPSCLAEHLRIFPEMARGESRTIRPLAEPRDCGFCDEDDNDLSNAGDSQSQRRLEP